MYGVADIRKGNEAVEQVIAVVPPADDVQVKIDLGRSEDADSFAGREDAQPPRSSGFAGFGGAAGAEAGNGANP